MVEAAHGMAIAGPEIDLAAYLEAPEVALAPAIVEDALARAHEGVNTTPVDQPEGVLVKVDFSGVTLADETAPVAEIDPIAAQFEDVTGLEGSDIERVADSYIPRMGLKERASSMVRSVRRIGRKATAGVATLALLPAASGALAASASAEGMGDAPAAVTSFTFNETLHSGKFQSHSAEDSANVSWVAYVKAKGMSKKVIKRAEAEGDCASFGVDTKKYYPNIPHRSDSYWNTGRSINGGMVTFKATKAIEACKDDKGVYREISELGKDHNCYNEIKPIGHKPKYKVIKGIVQQVKSFAHKTITLEAVADADANATCEITLPDGSGKVSASGGGHGHAEAHNKMSLSEYVKSKGAAFIRLGASIKDKVKADATANATADCEAHETTTTTTTTPTPTPVPSNGKFDTLLIEETHAKEQDTITTTATNVTPGDKLNECMVPDLGSVAPACDVEVADANGTAHFSNVLTETSDAGRTEELRTTVYDMTKGQYLNPSSHVDPQDPNTFLQSFVVKPTIRP